MFFGENKIGERKKKIEKIFFVKKVFFLWTKKKVFYITTLATVTTVTTVTAVTTVTVVRPDRPDNGLTDRRTDGPTNT